MKKALIILLVALMMAGGSIQSAQAALARVGPTNPLDGFPLWYEDTAGLRLDLCLDPGVASCLFIVPNPLAPVSFPNNYGAEAFWWAADALFDNVSNMTGLLVLAMEAAFAPSEVPVEGLQQAFARIRIRIDVPVAGTYTVTHPFGTAVYNVATPGIRAINETQDLGNLATPGRQGPFNIALADGPNPPLPGATVNADGRSIGPFLTSPLFPGPNFFLDPATNARYLSNGAPTPVVGSPFGTNFFRVVGPPGTAEVTAFNLTGKISVNQPAPADRAEYHVKTGKFHVRGFSAAVQDGVGNPTVVTIHLGADNTAPVLGTATVNQTTGRWIFTGKAPLSPGNPATSTVAIQSSADPGGVAQVLGLTLR
ncbi:MAG: hypothetical protein AB1346_12945 [Thermodesulfobacteriota bacterium]